MKFRHATHDDPLGTRRVSEIKQLKPSQRYARRREHKMELTSKGVKALMNQEDLTTIQHLLIAAEGR